MYLALLVVHLTVYSFCAFFFLVTILYHQSCLAKIGPNILVHTTFMYIVCNVMELWMQVRHYRTQGWPGLRDVRKWLGLVIIHGHKNGQFSVYGECSIYITLVLIVWYKKWYPCHWTYLVQFSYLPVTRSFVVQT